MESVATLNNLAIESSQSMNCARQQMPLSFLRVGEEACVSKIRGKGDLRHHLENLGFVPGASLRVISEQFGNMIVEIKGAQIALDRTASSKVITC